MGARKGGVGIDAKDGATVGWIYDETTGTITTNTTAKEQDDAGKLYTDY